ncbi:MAG: queuosine precursor transporter [Bacteroidota bacterium]
MSPSPVQSLTRPQKLYVICAAVFLTALVIAEATAGKLFTALHLPGTITLFGTPFDRVVMTAGVIAFPITFIVTDLVNEYFGKPGIRFLTWLGVAMVCFEFVLLKIALAVPTDPASAVPGEAFDAVFGTTTWVIVGSLVAYLVGQFADLTLFHWLRGLTNGRHLWLRATGSTLGSQFLDTFLVLFVAFYVPGMMTIQTVLAVTLFNYAYKVLIAIGITPLIYAAHWGMDRYLGDDVADRLIREAEGAG